MRIGAPERSLGRRKHAALTWLVAGLLATFTPSGLRADRLETSGRSCSPFDLAEDTSAVPPLSPTSLESCGARIGRIEIRIGNIFDPAVPGEGNWLFRTANRLHRTTREEVIRGQLLFRPGEPYSAEAVAESERLLRGERYLYDARILPVAFDGSFVDLAVETRDVWSLVGGVSFSRGGGSNTVRGKFEDVNFLGIGSEISAGYESNVDRRGWLLNYHDRHLFDRRTVLDLSYVDNSDGRGYSFDLDHPFYALGTRWAAGGFASGDRRVDSLYELGHIAGQFGHRAEFMEIYGGASRGLLDDATHRFFWGYSYARDRFTRGGTVALETALPPDRTLSYPWLAWEWVQNGFVATKDLDRISRTEDLNLGMHASSHLGWAARSFGSTENAAVFGASLSDGRRIGGRHLVLFDVEIDGRAGHAGAENFLASAWLRYSLADFSRHRFLVEIRADAARRLDPENQLLLGGDNGLRGYPLRYQDGDRRFLISLEQRFYDDHEFFHLVRFGAAIFFDAGKAWFVESSPVESLGILKDVGAGLRISSSRSARAQMVHLDVAFPLDGPRTISRVQWLVRTSETF